MAGLKYNSLWRKLNPIPRFSKTTFLRGFLSAVRRHVACNLLCCAVACAFLSACGSTERELNRERLTKLRKGMSKEDVLAVMGEPLTKEKYHRPNVWYYYTDWDWADGVITSSECTPLVFEHEQLAGWGQAFYREHHQKDWRD